MAAHCHLVEIDLSDNAFGPNGIVGLVDLLKSPSCFSLQELKLNNNGLGITGGKVGHSLSHTLSFSLSLSLSEAEQQRAGHHRGEGGALMRRICIVCY